MATLVLSTVGSALGGPVGGAIGALIGQSFDQQILGPGSRGPRVGDLSVQTSSYGTQIPRIYGVMRVAGSVIWSTDLVESTQTAGAKGQPDTTYSYAVSCAVALSSRPAGGIGRIWADGKLLRGAEGDFKVPVTFRFYDGSEDQIVDPLIASIEGIGSTPAYRGLSLAVFEGLELAEYGNRIPFLTFEVLADSTPAEIGGILNDASLGAINCDDAGTVGGYAAYGRSIGSALEPLISTFRLNLFDDGSVLRSPANGAPAFVDKDALGNSADNEPTARIQREQASARDIPAALRLSYYDASRDYLTGEARAVASEAPGIEEQRDLPAVLDANAAKGLAQAVLAKAWARRDKLTLRLPPAWTGLEPGQTVELELTPRRWTVTKITVDGLVVVAELEPAIGAVAPVAADAGRALIPGDIVEGEVSIAMIDAAMLQDSPMAQPTVLLAATSPTPGWRAKAVEVTYGGQRIADQTSRRKAIMGTAATALPGTDGTVDVMLTDPEQWLVSCDESALDEGANLALLGGELIQFTTADALGSGQFRLSGLVRGVRGTEVASHAAGDRFLLIEAQALKPIALPPWVAGYDVTAAIGERSATVRLPGKPEPAAIAEPSGGVTADAEAREAIAQMLAAMREQGLIAS